VLVSGRVGDAPRPPATPFLIYDGNCGFCRRWVRRAKRLDTRGVVCILPLQDPEATRLSGQPATALRQAAHFVTPEGAVFAGAAAIREMARYLKCGYVLRLVMAVPGMMPVAERVYAWIARKWGPVRD
jgi:acetyl esterase